MKQSVNQLSKLGFFYKQYSDYNYQIGREKQEDCLLSQKLDNQHYLLSRAL